MHDVNLSARENITTIIYRQIKMRLMTGHYKPGDVIKLRDLSEEIQVSQTPVREALLQLVCERVLSMERGKSITVPKFDEVRLQDLRTIRLSLELMAARRATQHMSEAVIHELEQQHDAMVQAKKNENREGTLRHNFLFHSTLYAASRMPDLIAIIEGLWAQTGPSLTYLYRPPFVHLEGEHPHMAIIKALNTGDEQGVADAIESDVINHGKAMMKRLPRPTDSYGERLIADGKLI